MGISEPDIGSVQWDKQGYNHNNLLRGSSGIGIYKILTSNPSISHEHFVHAPYMDILVHVL